MNKIMNFTGLSFKINERENYSFSMRGLEFLCLNKRLVEIGIGTCVVTSILRDFNVRKGMYTLDDKMAFVTDYVLPVGFGLGSIVKFGGYEGLSWLLFSSTIFNNRPNNLNESKIEILFWSACSISATMGRGITCAAFLNASLFGTSFLINQLGWHSLRTMLNRFNDWQNRAVSGTAEIKNNLKYQLSLFGRDVFCLNKTLLNTYFVLACFLTFSYHIEAVEFVLTSPGLLRTASAIAGVCTLRAIFKDYSAYFVCMLGILCMTPTNFNMLCQFLLLEAGAGMIYGGTGLAIFALFSYLTKMSGNKHAISVLNYLKDKRREKEYKQDIENQRRILEKRTEEIKEKNKEIYSNKSRNIIAIDAEVSYTKTDRKPRAVINKKMDKPVVKVQDKEIGTTALLKKAILVEVKKEYIVNLTGKNLITWNQLFEITKSKPDHLVISAKAIKNLIEALGGTIKPGSKKKINIYFNGVRLGWYEITHGGDTPNTLTSDYAQNVKKALEKAVDSGYVSEHLVKIKKRS